MLLKQNSQLIIDQLDSLLADSENRQQHYQPVQNQLLASTFDTDPQQSASNTRGRGPFWNFLATIRRISALAKLLFPLRNVPDDEAQQVRDLLNEKQFDWYETSAGNWGISLPALWLKDDSRWEEARTCIDEFQEQLGEDARREYQDPQAARASPHCTWAVSAESAVIPSGPGRNRPYRLFFNRSISRRFLETGFKTCCPSLAVSSQSANSPARASPSFGHHSAISAAVFGS